MSYPHRLRATLAKTECRLHAAAFITNPQGHFAANFLQIRLPAWRLNIGEPLIVNSYMPRYSWPPKLAHINYMPRALPASKPAYSSRSYSFLAIRDRDPVLDSIAHVQATAAHIANRNQLSDWVLGPLHALIPHQKAILGFGQVGYSTIRIDLAHTIGLVEDYFAATHNNTPAPASPVMSKWLQQRVPQTFRPDYFCRTTHGQWHNNITKHQVENGVLDASVEYAAGRLCFVKL
ncbi:MAG: hypothetical protein ABI583_02805, partial [Betaproteobacteria bacterium]